MNGKIGALWERDDVQFIRLVGEMSGLGLLTITQKEELCESMDISPSQLEELLNRAEEKFESLKDNLVYTKHSPWDTCQCCGHKIDG